MLGAIVGDIVGSRFEFDNHRSKEFMFFHGSSEITDDGVMTLAVANAIMETTGDQSLLSDAVVKNMQALGRQYPDCSYGSMFRQWLLSDNPQPYNSFGNGAAMRVSPCGYYGKTEEEVKTLSRLVTEVTHNHPEGIKGAEAVSIAIFMARNAAFKDEIRERIVRDYYALDFTLDEIRDTYTFNETCQETVPQAIVAFLESDSFEDAIRNAVSIGGDSDTVAAITGSIAEAYYGIERKLRKQTLRYLDEDQRNIYHEWVKFIKHIWQPKRYKYLTKYIGKLIDSELRHDFLEEFYWIMTNGEYNLVDYFPALKHYGLEFSDHSLRNADFSHLDIRGIFLIILSVMRADHFCYGILETFISDGTIDRWLGRMDELDSIVLAKHDRPELVSFVLELDDPTVSQRLDVSYETLLLQQNLLPIANLAHAYQVDKGFFAERLDALLEAVEEAFYSEGWVEGGESSGKHFRYTLKGVFSDESWMVRHGVYNRANMPEAPWIKVIYSLAEFLSTFMFEGIINNTGFEKAIKPGEYKYCSVVFQEGGQEYYYRTEDETIVAGDGVFVPVGKDNNLKEAVVVQLMHATADRVPWPLDETKTIDHKIDSDTSEPVINGAEEDQASEPDTETWVSD